jgi:hypothetical protein
LFREDFFMKIFCARPMHSGIASALAAVVLTSCTVVVEEGPRPLPPPPGPQFCTQQYDPVCARRGATVRTFGNACEARADGYRILYGGECRSAERPQFCTREYRPVCARRGSTVRKFGNACEADAAGYRIIYGGRC